MPMKIALSDRSFSFVTGTTSHSLGDTLLCDHLFKQKKQKKKQKKKTKKKKKNWLSLLSFDAGKNTWKQSVV